MTPEMLKAGVSEAGPLTPEMVHAGVRAWVKWDESDDWSCERLVIGIYRAMLAASPDNNERGDHELG